MKRRQKISNFINSGEFEPDSRPDRRTVIAAIKRGDIAGELFMGQWWVIKGQPVAGDGDGAGADPTPSTGNLIADKILAELDIV